MTQDERFSLYLIHNAWPFLSPPKPFLAGFSSVRELFDADSSDWQTRGLPSSLTRAFLDLKKQGELYEIFSRDYEEAGKAGYKFLTGKEIEPLFISLDPQERPFGVWIHGDEKVLFGNSPRISIVGTRRPTFYGRSVARDFAFTLGQFRVVVVSGLARGIDTISHQSVIEAGSKTIAVLGTGLNHYYPRENKKLQKEVVPSQGVVLTDFPLNRRPDLGNFPRRNRLIAALSLAVIVIEGDKKSGALITASWAAKQGKDVFAVPGNIDSPMSRAPNFLIREGATPLTCREDLVGSLPELKTLAKSLGSKKEQESSLATSNTTLSTLGGSAQKIFNALSREPLSLDSVILVTGLSVEEVNTALLELEISGLIRNCLPYGYIKEPAYC